MRITYLAVAILAALLAGGPVAAQSAADLLQKGIYNQETVGNLDAAIQLYRQVIASGAESRSYAAQAQFRLGVCLLKKGDNAGAAKAFEELAANYPEQKELIAKAREYMPADFKLLPAPWQDGELLEYEMKMPGGMIAGTVLLTAEASSTRPENVILQSRYFGGGMVAQRSRVEVERDSMRPLSRDYFNIGLGDSQIEYEARQARVQTKGKEPKTIPLDGLTFDNEEALFLVRRLPLATGYKVTLPLVSPVGTSIKLGFAVLGIEDVQVKAGKFHCYKFEFEGIRQTYWIAMDAPRPVVKFDLGTVTIELASIRRVDTVTPVPYTDPTTGLAITAPPGWMIKAGPVLPAATEVTINILEPEGKAFAAVWSGAVKAKEGEIDRVLRSYPEDRTKTRVGVFKDYALRQDSVQFRQIAGQKAVSWIADYVENNEKKVEYFVSLVTDNSRCQFFSRTAASEFEEFRKKFDSIIETVRLK